MASVVDHYGTLWVGTMSSGLARLEPGSQTFRTYQTNPADHSRCLQWRHVLVRGHPWEPLGGTYGGGLARFDRASDSFRALRVDTGRRGPFE